MKYPLKSVFWKREVIIRDALNKELFKMVAVRPSLEALEALKRYGEEYCRMKNAEHSLQDAVVSNGSK